MDGEEALTITNVFSVEVISSHEDLGDDALYHDHDHGVLPQILLTDAVIICVFIVLVFAVLLTACLACMVKYPDVLDGSSNGEKYLRRVCGGVPVFTVFDYDQCRALMRAPEMSERPVPPSLFGNLFTKILGSGICSSHGFKQKGLRKLLYSLLDLDKSVKSTNWCFSQAMESLRERALRTQLPLGLKEVEALVTESLMTVFYDVSFSDPEIWNIDVDDLNDALDNLFDIKEQLGKMVYKMNLLNFLRQSINYFNLLRRHNQAHEEVTSFLRVSSVYKLETLRACNQNFTQSITDADIQETTIEALMFCKKKLGYAVYLAMKGVAQEPCWQEDIMKYTEHHGRGSTSYISINEEIHECRSLIAIVLEALRLSELRLCCHLRLCTDNIDLTDETSLPYIPKGSVVHIASRFDSAEWLEPDSFHPEAWFEEGDVNKPLDRLLFYSMSPFGAGSRSCPGRRFACTVIASLLVHVARFGHLELQVDPNGHEEDVLWFLPRTDLTTKQVEELSNKNFVISYNGRCPR